MQSTMKRLGAFATTLALVGLLPGGAYAADPNALPARDTTWGTVSSVTAVAGVATVTLLPRIFYADPETTAGWKARWHVSVLTPTLANLSLTLLNEYALKDAIGGHRPDCDDTNQGQGNCRDFGTLSSHAFLSFSALGQGAAVFLTDTLKWSNGQFHAGSLVGNLAVPLIFSGVTAIGRGAGNWESGGTLLASSGAGLLTGFLTGITYAMLQRPECGYSGSLVCW